MYLEGRLPHSQWGNPDRIFITPVIFGPDCEDETLLVVTTTGGAVVFLFPESDGRVTQTIPSFRRKSSAARSALFSTNACFYKTKRQRPWMEFRHRSK